MTTDDTDDETLETLAEYLRLNPDATMPEVLGATDTDPSVWGDVVDDVLTSDEPHLALEAPDTGAPEGGFRDKNPGLEADKPASPTPETPDTDGSALVGALEWFHQQLDRDLPDECDHDTPRDYYREGRGWGADTIDEKLLGYAPANYRDELVSHLFDRGHDREAILSTGLFGEDLRPLWHGRYVLPYFDTEGRPVYAIARETTPKHPEDFLAGKYGKLAHTRDYADVEEPIYGLDTVREGEPVLITEGIADAITAHEAGYPCLSPVTKQFKKKHHDVLLEALAERDVDRVYLIQDAERPTSDVDDRDRLTLQQFGPGIKGAVRTAAYLDDHGLEARVAELPRPGLAKVDLDDYLQGWSDDLTPLLAGAKPVGQHPAHDPDTGSSDTSCDTGDDHDGAGREHNGERSALFDLDITGVTGESEGFRGKSPLGHHGDSENYFVVYEDATGETKAGDHKHGVTYTPLTYLLADAPRSASSRTPGRPGGSLNDQEIFVAWKHAKDRGDISDDDPIPQRALQHVAREATEWDGDLVEHDIADGDTFDGLPRGVYNAGLQAVREEYDLDPGRHSLGREASADAEPVAALPFGALDALDPEERKRALRRRGYETPDTADARRDLQDAVFREMRAGNTTVLDAPTALGKTYTVATEPWRRRADMTGESPVVHLHPTTDARDDAARKTRDSSATGAVLKGRKERCPVAAGDHDPTDDPDAEDAPEDVVTIDGEPAREWFDRQCDAKGLPFSTAHALARERNDQGGDGLPCCDDDGADCPAVAQWDGLPRTDDGEPAVDVIQATHQFAYVPSLRRGTNVILDEQPDFTVGFTDAGTAEAETGRIRSMVNAYLRAIDAPVSTWEAFVSLARFDPTGPRSDAGAEQDALDDILGTEPPTEWYVENPDAHALAPDLTLALWRALRWEDADDNGRRAAGALHNPPRLDTDDGDGFAGVWLSVVLDDKNTVRTVRAAPDLSQARAVLGLDAHPSMPMWELNTGGNLDLTRDTVLDPTERRLWRRYERGLTVVQVGDANRPRSGGNAREWTNDARVRAVLDRLRDRYGDGFDTTITTKQVKPVLRRLLADATDTPRADLGAEQTMHYGEEKSRNPPAFADADAGYVYGCMDPGDDMILDAVAELDLAATPATVEAEDGTEYREKGRTFDGADADTARALLASVRENHVAQAAGRYARDPDAADSGAAVYVHTNAAPHGFADIQTPGVEWLPTDTQREIVNTLAERPSATVRELADAVGCTKPHVRDTLDRLEAEDVATRAEAAGDHGADVYHADDADPALLDLGDTANGPLCDLSRWSLAVSAPHAAPDVTPWGDTGPPPGVTPATGDDPPPDPVD